MITDVLLDHQWLCPTALVALGVIGLVGGRWVAARPRAGWALAVASLVPVAVLTLLPVHRELYARCTVQWALPTPGRVELTANVVLFVAPVLFASLASRRPVLAFGAAVLLSALVETVQALVPQIGRSCDTGDWLCNAIGAAIGAALAMAASAMHRRPAPVG